MADIKTYLTSLENLIVKNNVTTSSYDISASLNNRVQTFYKGVNGLHENIPIANNLYPAVITEIDTHGEEFRALGSSSKRDITVNYNIACVTMYGAGRSTGGEAAELACLECIQLSQNVMNLLRAYPRLSNTAAVIDSIIDDIEYNARVREEYYNYVSNIKLTVKMRVT